MLCVFSVYLFAKLFESQEIHLVNEFDTYQIERTFGFFYVLKASEIMNLNKMYG